MQAILVYTNSNIIYSLKAIFNAIMGGVWPNLAYIKNPVFRYLFIVRKENKFDLFLDCESYNLWSLATYVKENHFYRHTY